jgi:hypothetical protein
VTACYHVVNCYRHSARNNAVMLPHPAACNLITSLLCLSSRNAKPCASPGLKLRSEPCGLISLPHSVDETVYEYCKAQWLLYVLVALIFGICFMLTHCMYVFCIIDTLATVSLAFECDKFNLLKPSGNFTYHQV